MDRQAWVRHVAGLDPEADCHEIVQVVAGHEFPWDVTQALSFALFRTYAVPSIGGLLARTGEFTERTQKRYDDTALILDAVLEHGLASPQGRTAVRRMNSMHRAYGIGNDDLRYVLSTFVVTPIRWLDAYGWRPLSEAERVASVHYYRALGRHMGIRDLPGTWQGFEELLDAYEREHFGPDEGARRVARATIDLMTTFPPGSLLPAAVVRRVAYALMDAPLLDALGLPHPTRAERALVGGALRLRARVLRHLPARRDPVHARDLPVVRSYPDGYDVAALGTFPPGCPVAHGG